MGVCPSGDAHFSDFVTLGRLEGIRRGQRHVTNGRTQTLTRASELKTTSRRLALAFCLWGMGSSPAFPAASHYRPIARALSVGPSIYPGAYQGSRAVWTRAGRLRHL